MLRIGSIRWKCRCHKHPGYTPEMDGLGGIRGGCKRCELLLDIYNQHASLVRLIREFGSRAETKPKPADDEDARRQMSLLDII
jgi:hypothetical protein